MSSRLCPAAQDAAHHFARPLPVHDRSAFVDLGGPVSSLALPPSAGRVVLVKAGFRRGWSRVERPAWWCRRDTGRLRLGVVGRRLLAEGRSVEGWAGRPPCRPLRLWLDGAEARNRFAKQSVTVSSSGDGVDPLPGATRLHRRSPWAPISHARLTRGESTARTTHALDRVQAPIGASDLCHSIVGGYGRWVADRGFECLGRRPLRVDRDPVAVDACV
jgi:hypothetical protein